MTIKAKGLLLVSVLMFFLSGCSSNVVLHSALTEQEANEVFSVLVQQGYPAEKLHKKEGISILVPERLAAEALGELKKRGLPRSKKSSLGSVFEKSGVVSSPLEEKARYLYAISQELEQTLLTLDGVVSARVHIVLPEQVSPGEQPTPSSVAILVKHQPDSTFPAYVSQIRELVLSGIPRSGSNKSAPEVSIVAVPAEVKDNMKMDLVWFGPVALQEGSRIYFLLIVYLIVGLWLLSLAATYLVSGNRDGLKKIIDSLKGKAVSGGE